MCANVSCWAGYSFAGGENWWRDQEAVHHWKEVPSEEHRVLVRTRRAFPPPLGSDTSLGVCDVHPLFLKSAVLSSRTVPKLVCRHSFSPKLRAGSERVVFKHTSYRCRLCPRKCVHANRFWLMLWGFARWPVTLAKIMIQWSDSTLCRSSKIWFCI